MNPSPFRAYPYKVTVPPEELPITLSIFKAHLKRSPSPSSEDVVLTLYLGSAISYAEQITRRDFIRRTYRTFRDSFPPCGGFEIRRSPLVSIETIGFTSSGGVPDNVVDPITYYSTEEQEYSKVLLRVDQEWPTEVQEGPQSVYLDFVCGLSQNSVEFMESYPDLTLAVLNHATYMWSNRGDCGSPGSSLPRVSRSVYLQNRIENL